MLISCSWSALVELELLAMEEVVGLNFKLFDKLALGFNIVITFYRINIEEFLTTGKSYLVIMTGLSILAAHLNIIGSAILLTDQNHATRTGLNNSILIDCTGIASLSVPIVSAVLHAGADTVEALTGGSDHWWVGDGCLSSRWSRIILVSIIVLLILLVLVLLSRSRQSITVVVYLVVVVIVVGVVLSNGSSNNQSEEFHFCSVGD